MGFKEDFGCCTGFDCHNGWEVDVGAFGDRRESVLDWRTKTADATK